jgi:hypothetical protein
MVAGNRRTRREAGGRSVPFSSPSASTCATASGYSIIAIIWLRVREVLGQRILDEIFNTECRLALVAVLRLLARCWGFRMGRHAEHQPQVPLENRSQFIMLPLSYGSHLVQSGCTKLDLSGRGTGYKRQA